WTSRRRVCHGDDERHRHFRAAFQSRNEAESSKPAGLLGRIRRVKISIAMCTYNGARFLPAQLESIVRQSRPPDEIVICDDRSTDDTRALLQQVANDARFQINLNENNLGTVKNFEQAVSLCTGDVIALSDQDDVWREDKLQTIEAAFERNPKAGLVFSDAEIVDETLNSVNRRMWHEVGFDDHK